MYEVRSFSSVDNLRYLRDFFLSSLGSKGAYKILVTSAGQVRVSSTSDRLVGFLSGDQITDPCAEAIINFIKGHLAQNGDFGLTVGALTCDFTNIFKEFRCRRSLSKAAKIISNALNDSTIQVDVSNLRQMISIVKSILNSKPAVVSHKPSRAKKDDFLQNTSVKVLEGFLESIPTNHLIPASFDLSLAVHIGSNPEAELIDGYLYVLPEITPELEWQTKRLSFQRREDEELVKVIFLNLNLKDDSPEFTEMQEGFRFQQRSDFEYMIGWISRLAKFCEDNEVEVILNQKVVCIEAQQILLKKGIAVYERLGTTGLKKVFKMSGAKQILENICQNLDRADLMGELNKPKIYKSGKCIQFYRQGFECKTLLVNSWSEDSCDEIELCYRRAIDVLYKLLRKPEVFPGGGCLEANIYKSLLEEKSSSSDFALVYKIAKSFARLALSSSRNFNDTLQPHYEAKSGHLWYLSDESESTVTQTCQCGMLKFNERMKFKIISILAETVVQENAGSNEEFKLETESDKLCLDFAESKRNGIFAALETADTLASIGKVVLTY